MVRIQAGALFSKEIVRRKKRSDGLLLTLGLTLDARGLIRHSQVFEGNVNEGGTLQKLLTQFQAPEGALVIMDAGISSEKISNDSLKIKKSSWQTLEIS